MTYDFQTFDQGRQCKHCEEPIADQAHGLIEYCERDIMEDGSIKSCKDDYNALLRKADDEPYRDLMAFQKRMTASIAALYEAVGQRVTLEQLNASGIHLHRAVEMQRPKGLMAFFFIHFKIEQLSSSHFKISKHVSVF